jgi:hypothetical protein
VQWLENQGSYPYTHHHLCEMPGVMNAKAADFDGDGDMDVVAAALLVASSRDALNAVDSSSVVMLMQTDSGMFERTKVEGKSPQHVSLEVGDFDADGKQDFAIGNFIRLNQTGQFSQPTPVDQPDLTIWWNRP